jgi:hypothetical protein
MITQVARISARRAPGGSPATTCHDGLTHKAMWQLIKTCKTFRNDQQNLAYKLHIPITTTTPPTAHIKLEHDYKQQSSPNIN